MKKIVTFFAAVVLTSNIAFAAPNVEELKGKVNKYLTEQAPKWLNNKIVIDSIKKQNAENANMTEEAMKALDAKWKEEVKTNKHDLITKTLANDLSKYLKGVADASTGVVSETFIMDAKGLDAGKSGVTSSMYRGDKPKFKDPFSGKNYVGDVEFDESTQQYVIQGATAVKDEGGNTIGVVVISFSAEKL